MNTEIINYPTNLEEQIIQDSKIFYPSITLQKSDLERFIRKCFRDENFLFCSKYIIICKITSTIFTFNELSLLKFNLSRPVFSTNMNNISFSLPEKIKNNEKVETIFLGYLKKISSFLSEINESLNEKDYLMFYPPICTINYLISQNLLEWLDLCSLKECNNISFELKSLSENLFEKLSEKYPFVFNSLTYKIFLRIKRR